jgi:electron transport complex protein RnfG
MVNEEKTLTMRDAIRQSAIGLAIFAFFTAGIISVTQFFTKDIIQDNERAFEARLLLSILPEGFEALEVLNSAKTFASTGLASENLLKVSSDENYYAISQDDTVSTIILPAIAPEGYTEAIRLIVGISADGEVIGVRITRHKETPGLGDQVEISKSDWVLAFNGKSLNFPVIDDWLVKKDGGEFDQLTGATITPRAIVKAVKNSLVFFEENKTVLLGLDQDS